MKVEAIGIEMVRQNNRSTQNPLFVVMTDKRIYMPHSLFWDYDGKERLDEDIQELDIKYLCKRCRKIREDGERLPDDCNDCQPECFNWYKIEKEIEEKPGVFFTAKACQRHIDQNRYHYSNPCVYGISAWRNPEMASSTAIFD